MLPHSTSGAMSHIHSSNMNASFIERIFPRQSAMLLPQHERRRDSFSSKDTRTPASSTGGSGRSPRQSPSVLDLTSSGAGPLTMAPLSASLVHHDDPFLPIERAARALQQTIQSLLDIQSTTLAGRLDGHAPEDAYSVDSTTPTQSHISTSRQLPKVRTVPIRQPKKKKVTLKGARRGLGKSMIEMASLRQEELQLLEYEDKMRIDGLLRVDNLQDRRQALVTEISSISQEESSAAALKLREEANKVTLEVIELEHRIFELKVRHTHLLAQAEQMESSLESKASSFRNTLFIVDNEAKEFLRRPPVQHAFVHETGSLNAGLYALRANRRTMEMAKEQWTSERKTIADRRLSVEREKQALLEGEEMWAGAVARINDFERQLREHTQAIVEPFQQGSVRAAHATDSKYGIPANEESMRDISKNIDKMIESLENDVSTAESRNWNLLIAALGAELEAFYQARDLLRRDTPGSSASSPMLQSESLSSQNLLDNDNSASARSRSCSSVGSDRSNQSLKDTLTEFRDVRQTVDENKDKGTEHRYESEDDEPPPDFMVSQ